MANPVQRTFGLVGVYDENGEETSHKVRVMFSSSKAAKRYDLARLQEPCQNWLDRHYPGETIANDEFDLDNDGEFESAENDDVIVAPQ